VKRGELWGEFEHPAGIDVVPGVKVNINDCRFLGVVYREMVGHPGNALRETDPDESAQPRDKRVRARVVCITVRGAFDRAWMHSHTKDLLADLRGEDEHDNRKLATNLLAFIDSGNEEACHDLDDADYDA
jgi:hypothetical protein